MKKGVNIDPHLLAIYARVSTAKQEEQETIKTQLAAVREFASTHGYHIAEEYVDDGWSGDILARPELDRLRQDAKKKIWQAVLIYDPDRLARRYSYQELIFDELREKGIEVLFVTTPSPKTGEERILHGVKGLFAEYERTKIAERFRLGKLRKVREGHVLLSEAPYGYRYVPKKDKEHGYFEMNEEEAQVVRMIFRWVGNDGFTLRRVVGKLQELGVRPRKSKRGVWSTSTLGRLLRNSSYIGEAHYGKTYAIIPERHLKIEKYRKMKKTSRKVKPREEWIKIPVPSIVDPDLFETVQRQLKINFVLAKRNKSNEYLLGGKIWCSCNSRRTGEGPRNGKHLYYRCNTRINQFPLPSKCEEKAINARVADSLVWDQITRMMSSPLLITQQANRWLSKQERESKNSTGELETLRGQIVELKAAQARYMKAYGANLLSIDQLSRYVAPINERLAALEGRVTTVQALRTNAARLPSEKEIRQFAQQASKTLQNLNFDQKRAIVREVVDRVVGTQERLHVYGAIPIAHGKHELIQRDGADTTQPKTLNVGYKTIHRHRVDTTRREDLPSDFRSEYWPDGKSGSDTLIPFDLIIPLPSPRYDRIITDRDKQGKIIRSAAA